MADVSVNIRGRDDGLGASLDSLREKAQALGRDVSSINQSGMSKMTPTEQRLAVENTAKETLRAKQDAIRSEYSAARKANIDEFSQAESRFSQGKMSASDFELERKKFDQSQTELNKDEQAELIATEKEMNQHLRIIVREMVMQKRLERERAQRDDKEHSLREREEKEKDQEKDENGEVRTVVKREEKEKDDEDRSGGSSNGVSALMGAGTAAAHGNLQGTVSQTIQGGASVMGISKAGAATAAAFLAAYGLIDMGDQVINASGEVGVMRGRGMTGSQTAKYYAENVDNDGMIGNVGMKSSDFLAVMKSKAQESGRADDLRNRTLQDVYFQRGTGADAGVYSKFERFTTNQETSATIAMETLNVLARIEKSSLKEGDLAVLQEKMNIQANLFDIQRSKRDAVDVDDSLRIMAAFESIGLSQKGERGGEFLSQTIAGLGEGGGDNAMLLKYEAAKRARPDLANDPAALRRFVKFHSDDPEYMKSAFGFFGEITNNNDMARDDLMYTMFNPQSEYDMDMWSQAMQGGGKFNQYLSGKGIDKTQRGTLTGAQIQADAEAATGGLTQLISDFKNQISDIGVSINNWLEGVTGSGDKAINVRTKGGLQMPSHNVNRVKTGSK